MADLLLFFKDIKSCFNLEELAISRGLRVKSTSEYRTAMDWVKLRDFEIALIDSNVPTVEQQGIGGALWQKNPMARFLCFNLDPAAAAGRRELGARLFGAEVALGTEGLNRITIILDEIAARDTAKLAKMKVLVVEDLDSPRDIICTYLEGIGYPNAVGVNSAAKAIELIERDPREFGCIITDFKMPDLSGAQLIERIRARAALRHIPILVLTAYGTSDCLVDCLKAGASGFLVKPPRRVDLGRELAKAARLLASKADPRLAKPEEAEAVRDLLAERGLS